MAANPITETEFEAYRRRRHIVASIWEGDVLMRLDDAVLEAANTKAPKTTPPPKDSGAIPVSNTAAIKSLFTGLMARKAKK